MRSTRSWHALNSARDAAEGEGAASTVHGSVGPAALRATADRPDVLLVPERAAR
jgi:hypothetical protein